MQTLDQIGQWPVNNASAAVVSDGGRGVANFGGRERVYPLASVAKLLCAYVALVVVEEGAIELGQRIYDHSSPATAPETKPSGTACIGRRD